MQNFYLIAAAILIGYVIYKRFAFIGNKNVTNVSAEEAYKVIKENKDIIILDVRTPAEYKAGHIKGAKSLPVANFAVEVSKFESYKDRTILVHCASGGRSPAAVRILLKNDFKNIYHMNRGLAGWNYELK